MQPVSGFNWTRLAGTEAGTTVLSSRDGVLQGVYTGTATTGTATFYDCAAADGTAATNKMFAHPGAVANNNNNVSAAVKKGITAVIGGTVDMLVTWS